MTAQLRQLEERDLDAVMALEGPLFGAGAWPRQIYVEELNHPSRFYIAVIVDEELVGYAGISLGPDADVMTIGVAPGHRRNGYAKAMLAALLDRARSSGSETVFLEVRESDEGAQSLYRSFGFVPLALRRGYYQPEGANALVMRLELVSGPRKLGPIGAEAVKERNK